MNKRRNKGITLIALVISVIILLIFTGVSLSLVLGEEGMIGRTISTKEVNEKSEEKELIELAVSSALIDGHGIIVEDNLNKALQETFNNTKIVSENIDGWKYQGNKLYIIYQSGKVEESEEVVEKLLPDEYIECEYIESTGTQYIDTKEVANDIKKINLKFSLTGDVNNHQGVLGGGYTTNSCTFQVLFSNFNKTIAAAWGTCRASSGFDTDVHIAQLSDTKLVLDNTEFDSSGESISDSRNIFLFARQSDDLGNGIQQYSYCRIYSCEMFDSTKKVRNFIPCYKKENNINKIGFFDTINNEFFENSGTGQFEKGSDVQ